MAARGDSRLTGLLQHERGREWSFTGRWPHKKPEPHCLAFSGFHYTGKDDLVQCVYCGGIIKNWTGDEDPSEIHFRLFPRCPLMNHKPVHNIGSTVMYRCCSRHTESLALNSQRLRMIHNPMQTYSYLVVLLTLLVSIGTVPLGYAAAPPAATASVIVTPASTAATNGQLHSFSTWKGLVGVRSKDFIVTEEYSSYPWILDLRTCNAAEAAIKELADKVAAVPTNTNADWPDSLKNTTLTLTTSIKEKIRDSGLKSVWDRLERTTAAPPARSVCQREFVDMLGPTLCSGIQMEVSTAILGGVSTLNKKESALAAIGMLTKVSDKFLEGTMKLRNFLDELHYGRLPITIHELMEGDCRLLLQHCPARKRTREDLDYGKLTKVTGLKTFAETEFKIGVDFITPCFDEEQIVTEYELKTLPFAGFAGPAELKLKSEKLWLQTQLPEKNLLQEPELCHEVSSNILVCPPQPLIPAEKSVCGTQTFLEIEGEELNVQKTVDFLDLQSNQVIVGASESAEILYQCPGERSSKFMINGTARFQLQSQCVLRAEQTDLEVIGSSAEQILNSQLDRNPFNLIPQYISFQDGVLKTAKLDWVEMALDMLEDHFNVNTVYYLGASTAALVLFILMFLCKFIYQNKQYVPCYVPPHLIVQV